MKLLLIDLDDTLIETKQFKDTLLDQISKKTSIPRDTISKIYEGLKVLRIDEDWEQNFMKEVAQRSDMKENEVQNIIDEHFGLIKIKTNILNYLNHFEGYKVILTYGRRKFQEKKIKICKLSQYVDQILITADNKLDFIGHFIEKNMFLLDDKQFEDVTFVDNEHEMLENIKKTYPWIHTMHVDDIV